MRLIGCRGVKQGLCLVQIFANAFLQAFTGYTQVGMTTTRITKNLYTAGLLPRKKKQKLGIASVLSLTDEVPKKKRMAGEIVFPLNNDYRNPPERIVEILHVVDMQIRNGYTPVLVHCEHGHDRSPTVAAAYLYYKGKFPSFDRALEHVERINPKIKPKKEFVSFVKEEVIPIIDANRRKAEPRLVA
jgi:protein-tyrosine phosphatase